MNLAVIGGTGFYNPSVLESVDEKEVLTEYGRAQVLEARVRDNPIVFLQRHARGHRLPPHRINYRANLAALKGLGVTHIIATSAVGSLREDMAPGDLVLLDQFIDFTRGRACTFFDGDDGMVRHTDMTEPYSPALRELILEAADALDIAVHPRGCYVCTEGPRFETPAEINMFRHWGADVVGMTNVPEVVLANELGIPYAALALVTNYGAGISPQPLTHEEVLEAMAVHGGKLERIVVKILTIGGICREGETPCPPV